MSQNITKRNHYLPQLYLNSFLINDVFWVYYKNGSEPVPQTPINTCVEKHIYNFKSLDGSIDDSIEKVLGISENNVKNIIERLLKPGARLETNDIPELAVFLSFMATRVPRYIELAREIGKEVSLNILKKVSQNRDEIEKTLNSIDANKEFTIEQVQKYFENPEEHFKLSINEKFAMCISLLTSKDIYYELMDMNWCLCKAPSGCYFVTSDAPLVPFVLDNDGRVLIGAGFGLDNVEITIPISPFLCLYMSRKRLQKYRAINKKFAIEINRRTAWNAERLIISHIKTKDVRELTSWASKSLSIPKIDKKLFEQHFLSGHSKS
jgi:hypothetical protein